jgi:hypothetical protein
MERLDGAGLQEVPEEARNLTSRAACCRSAIRRVESPLCCSHARQGLTSRHGAANFCISSRSGGISAIVSGRLPRNRLLACCRTRIVYVMPVARPRTPHGVQNYGTWLVIRKPIIPVSPQFVVMAQQIWDRRGIDRAPFASYGGLFKETQKCP